jgi:hypothetical protein
VAIVTVTQNSAQNFYQVSDKLSYCVVHKQQSDRVSKKFQSKFESFRQFQQILLNGFWLSQTQKGKAGVIQCPSCNKEAQ